LTGQPKTGLHGQPETWQIRLERAARDRATRRSRLDRIASRGGRSAYEFR
jgi:hypothetical protein